MTNKLVSIGKKAIGIILGLIVFALSFKVIVFIIVVISALGMRVINIHVSENHGALNAIEDSANILAFLFGAALFNKTYKAITGTVLFRVWGFSKRKKDKPIKDEAVKSDK
jgi:hypothetical protein